MPAATLGRDAHLSRFQVRFDSLLQTQSIPQETGRVRTVVPANPRGTGRRDGWQKQAGKYRRAGRISKMPARFCSSGHVCWRPGPRSHTAVMGMPSGLDGQSLPKLEASVLPHFIHAKTEHQCC